MGQQPQNLPPQQYSQQGLSYHQQFNCISRPPVLSESSYPAPAPPGGAQRPLPPPSSMYFRGTEYYSHAAMPPPPPPPSSQSPPPPPPCSPPLPPLPQENLVRDRDRDIDRSKSYSALTEKKGQHHKVSAPKRSAPVPLGKVENDEERRLRKKKDIEDSQRQQAKDKVPNSLPSHRGHNFSAVSRLGEKRVPPPLISSERSDNRLKKPTTFLCKLKFRNELPDPSAQPKLMSLKRDKDRFTKYRVTSLEKMYKPHLYVEPDLGIPLDLLDLSVYNCPAVKPALDPEDEELLRDAEVITPVKRDGIKRKDRPTDKGLSWLVKTQYISPLSTEAAKQSLSEKQAKELKEMKGGRNLLGDINDRARQIKDIEASFDACKVAPVHATNKNLKPIEILPLFPDKDRVEQRFVAVTFDSAPTADSEIYGKLGQPLREACESRAVMRFYVAGSEQFLGYMVPAPHEVSKGKQEERGDIAYNWIREYHCDVRGGDAGDPTTYLVSFDQKHARYLPLPTKINVKKKRPREGENEHFLTPAKVTLRNRSVPTAFERKDAMESDGRRMVKSVYNDNGRIHRHNSEEYFSD